ncbi:DUF4199 domain-containing protein [Sphingobacterium corticibacterium]|uniref:DUF4199 domain-containing protein n=1 Tax=Sphingobacterium corticibacterium TaxID=2484746 RepID=A0A4Q6XPU7_9SPHI|nr:DUF4199 domain-containing protein [Sphingobacterium corticibacterium]RZF62293.1 DUF4199 domain-containing protein [Sphingobacterium corticibacterium]
MNHDFNSTFPTEEVKKEGIKYGIYLGVISLVISIVSMYVLVNSADFKISSMVTGGVSFVLIIALSAYFAVLLRRVAGGFWNFSQALKGIFVMLAITVIISTVGGALFNLANPEPQQIVFDKTINLTIETMESIGADDDLIDKQVADLEKQRDELREFSIGQNLKGLGVALIMYFIFALILAAILKRERPVFLPVQNNLNQEDNERQDKPEEE